MQFDTSSGIKIALSDSLWNQAGFISILQPRIHLEITLVSILNEGEIDVSNLKTNVETTAVSKWNRDHNISETTALSKRIRDCNFFACTTWHSFLAPLPFLVEIGRKASLSALGRKTWHLEPPKETVGATERPISCRIHTLAKLQCTMNCGPSIHPSL